MPDDALSEWSPADNPHAIAVSESQWWLRCAELARRRIHDGEDARSPGFSSRQIDARQFVLALWQLLVAEKMEQVALRELDIDHNVLAELSRARQALEKAAPGVKQMRDALTHFDSWARGEGDGPQAKKTKGGQAFRDIARLYWGFGFDINEDRIRLGPYSLDVDQAANAARQLGAAIYQASRAVDIRNTAQLRSRVVAAIATTGLTYGDVSRQVVISPGHDLRIYVSVGVDVPQNERAHVSNLIVSALNSAGLGLASMEGADPPGTGARLENREIMQVRPLPA